MAVASLTLFSGSNAPAALKFHAIDALKEFSKRVKAVLHPTQLSLGLVDGLLGSVGA